MNRIRCYLVALGICLLSVAGLRAVVADPGGFPGIYEKDTPVLKQSGGREEGAEDAAEGCGHEGLASARARPLQHEGGDGLFLQKGWRLVGCVFGKPHCFPQGLCQADIVFMGADCHAEPCAVLQGRIGRTVPRGTMCRPAGSDRSHSPGWQCRTF